VEGFPFVSQVRICLFTEPDREGQGGERCQRVDKQEKWLYCSYVRWELTRRGEWHMREETRGQ